MSQIFEQLMPYLEKHMALQTALALFDWDDATLAPKEAGEQTAKVIGILAEEDFLCLTNPEVKKILEKFEAKDTERVMQIGLEANMETYEQDKKIKVCRSDCRGRPCSCNV